MTHPPLTVVTVVKNAEHVIEGCIRSVMAQNIEGLEYILIDGASTDRTLDIAGKYRNSISQLVSEPDAGLYDAMNKGLARSNGRYVHFLNADDRYFAQDTLMKLLPQLDEDSVNYGQLVYIRESGDVQRLGAPFSMERELQVSTVPQPTLFVAKKLYDQIGDFDLNYKIAADYDMVLRLVARFPAHYIDQPTTVMNAGGISYRRMGDAFREARIISTRHGRSPGGAYLTYLQRLLKWQITRWLSPAVTDRIRSILRPKN